MIGAALGALWGVAWAVALALGGSGAGGLAGALAMLLLPSLAGGALAARLPRLRRSAAPAPPSLGASLGTALALPLLFGGAFVAFRFVLQHSFDLLDEVAAVFAASILVFAVTVALGLIALARRWPGPAGRLAALPWLVAALLTAALASRVTAHILGFEPLSLLLVGASAALAAAALAPLVPAGWRARPAVASGVTLLACAVLAGSLALYALDPATRDAAWSGAPLPRSLAAVLADLTDADDDGISGSLGHGDCDDADPAVFPGQSETPSNGRDDNCRGGDVDKADVLALWRPETGPRAPASGQDLGLERRPWNVLLITLDATRADHLSTYGYGRPTSPNLDQLAQRSLTFDAAWSPSNFTATSLYSVMTGLYPSAFLQGTRIVARPGLTLAERLAAAGYQTEAIVDLHPALPHVYAGFARVDDSLGVRASKAVRNRSTASTADELASLGVAALSRHGGAEAPPFFLWMHLSEPHAEYLAHPGIDFGDADLDRYDAEIAAADAAVGRLLAAARDQGRLADTVIVVTSDHGESFGEHGVYTHGQSVYQEEIHVPLLISLPDGALPPEGRRLMQPMDLTDLMPTLLDVIGSPPGPPAHGETLLPMALRGQPLRTPEAVCEVRLPYARLQAWRRGDTKVIFDDRLGVVRTFDLSLDPQERAPQRGASAASDEAARWLDRQLALPRTFAGAPGSRPEPAP
ncbi:MAG: sulfatase-like hydrolase/transferase [Deltaproteobacteria bacterium]|nr:sulfatase-like hydrolase/transferase [Deltaproteobacteria bacterium]